MIYGTIRRTPANKARRKIVPLARHYEENGETPYIKYSCPICEAAGNHHLSFPKGTPDCPFCGVHLEWEEEIQEGDTVIVLVKRSKENGFEEEGFPIGTICTVRGYLENSSHPYLYYLRDREGKGHFYAREMFSRVMGPLDEE